MPQAFYFRDAVGWICAEPGATLKRLSLTEIPAPSPSTHDVGASELDANISALVAEIPAANWSARLWFQHTGANTNVRCVVEKRTSACVVSQTILDQTKTITSSPTIQEYTFGPVAVGAISIAFSDILIARVFRTSASGNPRLRYNSTQALQGNSRIQIDVAIEGSEYPGSIDGLLALRDGIHDLEESRDALNRLEQSIEAVEFTLGKNPQGSSSTVKARIAARGKMLSGTVSAPASSYGPVGTNVVGVDLPAGFFADVTKMVAFVGRETVHGVPDVPAVFRCDVKSTIRLDIHGLLAGTGGTPTAGTQTIVRWMVYEKP